TDRRRRGDGGDAAQCWHRRGAGGVGRRARGIVPGREAGVPELLLFRLRDAARRGACSCRGRLSARPRRRRERSLMTRAIFRSLAVGAITVAVIGTTYFVRQAFF